MNNGFMDNKATEFGRLCRSYRANLGLNMIQAAEKIGKKQATITKIELGKLPASFEFIKKSIAAYQIRDRRERMKFFLTYLKSAKWFEIPLDQLGPSRKEWLAALCILGEVDMHNRDGWDYLLQWLDEFREKLHMPSWGAVDNSGLHPF
jgi:transcriptional regulator with XRE-family HTH domain